MEKEFKVERVTNGMGHSNLLVIVESAVPDIAIGTAIIIPYANGLKDPVKVLLIMDENGAPKRANNNFAIVSGYIYE